MKDSMFIVQGGAWGSYNLVFIPTLPSQGKEGFFLLFSFDWKCHGASALWVLLICKANFIVMRA